ncbi:GrpB family protein [Catelliglobosispora koreensis]|uniref:GrpB family protein n=1 Tax=Catelliglobosispora koreensis TaxID=129052 RepID=UPI00037B0F4B|nr:GrpB family protein [Catelliglobosispora koreensis]
MRLDDIEIVPYDGQWAELFAQQQERVAGALRPWLIGPVEHIGSTSVPGLPAKAIIDMMARVQDINSVEPQAMQAIGWVPAPEPGDTDQRKLSFCYPTVEERSHHLHLVEHASEGWKTWLAFRDHLKAHPDKAAEYARIKKELAARDSRDRVAYRAGKAPFIEDVLKGL